MHVFDVQYWHSCGHGSAFATESNASKTAISSTIFLDVFIFYITIIIFLLLLGLIMQAIRMRKKQMDTKLYEKA